MRETTNRTPAWVYVVSVVSAVALGLGTIAIADYLRPSKRAARQEAAETQRWILDLEAQNREWRTKAEGCFFKGFRYALGLDIPLDFEKSVQNFYRARVLASPNDIAEFDELMQYFPGRILEAWNASKIWDGYR